MAQGLERIPLAVDSDFQAQPVRANFPEAPAQDFKLVSFEPDQAQAQPAPTPRSMGTVAADTAYGMAKGAGSLAKGIGWLAGSDGLQQAGQDAEDYWGEKQSADLHRQLEEVGKAEGVTGTIAALGNNPGAIGDYIATSLPMMVPGMAVGSLGARGIIAYAGNAARGAALRAGATEAAAMQAGRIAAEKAAEKAAMRFAVGANMLGEGAVSGGVTGAEVEKFALEHGATPEQAKAAANKSALMAGAWTTAGAGIGAGMETRAMLGRLKDSGIKGMAKNVVKEAAEEAIQNPGEDYAAYSGKVQFDPTQTFDPGKAATLGAVTGGAMGAGFHAAGRAGTIMRGEREDDNTVGAIPADEIGAGPGGGGSGAIEGIVLGPEQIADQRGGPIATRQPETYSQITPTALPRLALPAPEDGGPSERQVSTAIGLLKHSPKASPDLLQRLMRVDQTMATMLFNHWQGQTNGQVAGNEVAEIPAQGDQGQGADIAGSRVVDGFSDGAVSFTPDTAAEVAASGGEPGMALGAAGQDAVAASTPIQVVPKVGQPVGDSGFANTKFFGNSAEAQAVISHGFNSIDRERQGVVLSQVLRFLDQSKVLGSVVQAIPVDVMNGLVGKKVPPEDLLHNPSMLKDRLAIPGDRPVPEPVVRFIDALASIVKAVPAGRVAKESGLPLSGTLATELDPTVRASSKGGLNTRPATEIPSSSKANLAGNSREITPAGAASQIYDGHVEVSIAGQKDSVNTTPSEAQKQAGVYKKGHFKFQGMDISIENPAGSVRSGTNQDGKAWENTLQHHYGYIRGTTARDGDHVDAFIKPGAQTARTAYVIDQIDPKTGKYDEAKVILGADSEADAQAIYHANYEQGWQGMGAITAMPIEQFKDWIKNGKTKKPLAYVEPKGVSHEKPVPKAKAPAAIDPSAPYGKVGVAPFSSQVVGLQDNGDGTATVMRGEEPFYDFENGDPVTVPAGATAGQIRQAVTDAGALSSRDKWFGVAKTETKPAETETESAKSVTEPTKSASQPVVPVAEAGVDFLASIRTEFQHEGFRIYPISIRGEPRWAVQSVDNVEKEKKGERQIGGDAIVGTVEQAKKQAEDQVTERAKKAERQREFAKQDAADEAKREANRGLSITERRANAALDKPTNLPVNAGVGRGSRREAMESAVSQGRAIVATDVSDTAAYKRDEDEQGRLHRAGYGAFFGNDSHPQKMRFNELTAKLKNRDNYQKKEYRLYSGRDTDGGFYDITKTEYDYAKSLMTDGGNAKPVVTIAGKPVVVMPAEQLQKIASGVSKTFGPAAVEKAAAELARRDEVAAPKPTKEPWQYGELEFGDKYIDEVVLPQLRKELENAHGGRFQEYPSKAAAVRGLKERIDTLENHRDAKARKYYASLDDHYAAVRRALADGKEVPEKAYESYDDLKADVSAGRIKGDGQEVARVEQPQHIEAGQAEPATAPVIAASIKESAKNTPMNIEQAREWLLSEIDKAIIDANSAKEEGIWNRADDKVNLEGIMDVGATIGFKTFNVPGDGKFRVLNLKESLQKFKKQVAATPGFKKNATRPMSVANGSGGKTSVRDMLDEGEYVLAADYGRLTDDPLLFGAAIGNNDHPVAYTNAEPVDIKGVDAQVGREWNQTGKSFSWRVIETTTGAMISSGTTKERAISEALAKVDEHGVDKLIAQIKETPKVSQSELERQFTDWGSEEEAKAQKTRDAVEQQYHDDLALWQDIFPPQKGDNYAKENGRAAPWNLISDIAALTKDAAKAGKGAEFVALIERRHSNNSALAIGARKALADAAPKTKPAKGSIATGVASKILGDIYQRAAYNKWTWDRLKSYLTREMEEAGVGKSRMANALEKAMTEYARTANGRLGYPNSNLVFSAMRDYGLIAEGAPDAQQESSVDYKGFERTPTGNGNFTLKDGNLLVKVEAMGGGKFQASHGSAKSSPHINSEQGAVDWAADLRDASKKTAAYPFYSNNKLFNAEGTAELPKDWTGVARSDSGKRFFYLGQENGERSFNPLKAESYEDALKEADGLKNDKPVVPEGYREVARGYFGGTVEKPIYAPFAEGERVRFIGGHAGQIQSFIGGPVTTGAIIKYDNGLTGRAEWRDVEAAPPASIAGKPVSEMSDGMLNQIAKSSQPAAEKAKAEVAKRKKPKADPLAAVREFYTPGNIIHVDYWNQYDKVLEFKEGDLPGQWNVKVQQVKKDGDQWVPKDDRMEPPRWHATAPGKDKIVDRVAMPTEQDRDSFTLERLNGDAMEPVTFERGEYVRYTLGGKDQFGDIDGISHARREFSVDGLWYPFGFAYKAERPAPAKAKDTVPLSSVVDAVNKKHGEGLTDADRVPTQDQSRRENPNIKTTLADHDATTDRLRDGTATLAEYKAAFQRLQNSTEELTAEFAAMKKDDILKHMGGQRAHNYKSDTKDKVVAAAVRDLMDDFSIGRGISYTMGGRDAYANAVRAQVERTTDADLAEYAEHVKSMRAARTERVAQMTWAMKDPKTLADFKMYLDIKAGDTVTREQARMMLTPEQRVAFDELAAEQSREERKGRADQQRTEVRAPGEAVGASEIIKTKHTKHGHDLWQFTLERRVPSDEFKSLVMQAKRMGGDYSSYRGNGAIPGWQFRTEEAAIAFRALVAGDTAAAKEVMQTRRDDFEDDRSQTAVERLTEMADRLEERADESLNRDRKENTDRRARMAASAEAAANSDNSLAKTMRNIAQAIESGKTKFLDRVRQKAQVEMLRGFLHTAKANELRAKFPNYGDQEKHRAAPPTAETADYVDFPRYTAFRSDLATMGRQMLDIDGAKKTGAALLKVADDVSAAYLAFAKEHLHQVSTFKKKDSAPAIFASRDDAETAIKRSGFKGKAVVLPFKRGQNIIIMSPSAAKEAGIWKGDDDKRITLTPDFGEEVVAKVKEFSSHRISMPYLFESVRAERTRLKAIGIETAAELRAALREFMDLRAAPPEVDKIRQMERAMIGRKNDGLDFFPTPASVADELVQAAGIEEGMAVLEPSAGMGHIAERIRAAGVDPDVVEMASDRRELLEAKGFRLVGSDFMDMTPRDFTYGDVFRAPDGTLGVMRGSGGMGSNRVGLDPLDADGNPEPRRMGWYDRDELEGVKKRAGNSGYDRIIMNPPFSDRRDAQHVQHAYTLLKPGGRLVAIMGEGVFFGQDKKAQAFRDWLEEVGGTSEKLEEGTFLDPSLPVNTGVNARMVVVEKGEGGAIADPSSAAPGQFTSPRLGNKFANASEAVEWLAQNMDGEGYRHVAQKILPVVRSVPIHYVSVGDTVPAKVAELLSSGSAAVAYQAGDIADGKDAIYVLEGKGDTEEGLLHEALHIATSRRLIDATAAAEFSGMAKAIRSSLYDAGAKSTDQKFKQAVEFFRREFRSPGELVAYGFSSPAFQDLLKLMAADGKFYTDYRTPEQLAKVNKNASFQPQKRIPAPAYSMWHRFVDAVRALFGGPKAYQEAYERATAANAAIDRNNELASRVEFETLEEKLNSLLDALLQRPELGISKGGAAQPIRGSGLESRSRSTGFASTESTRAIQSIVDKFLKQFAGAADLDIRVVRTVADIPERFRPSPFAEGTFNDDAGLIYLVGMNLKHANGQVNAGRVWQVLMHEAVGHAGLAKMMGSRFGGILKEVMRAARAKGEVGEDIYGPGHPDYATIEAVRLRYTNASDEVVAEEVLARMAETDPGRTLFGYVRAVVRQWLRDMARAAGITLDVTTAELNDLVAQASRYMRRGDGVAQGVDVDALGVADMAVGGMASKATGMESRAAPTAGQPKEPRTGILDTILRKAGGELAAKITGPAYDKLTAFLGGKVPEGIKAGMVSDYGLDESYVDRRTGMQTEQQKAARQTKTFVEGMMGLDRAQSRVAYQWLNNRGAEADRLMAQLPAESQQVLKDIKIQIAKLTIEAVRLGQLDAETAERNFLAYLHRSYAKYDLNTDDKTWKAERAKAIKILGDQYKGRGLKMDVDPDRIHSAPGWWQDEMKGKRVKVLKNEAGRFAFVAEGTAIPPNLSGYKIEGVWEIRARKAADRITLWRDFTQDERQMMGELDEAKYAVARTLFMMNRDIEVGRFHEWVADEYAKTPEEAEEEGLQMADASDSMMRAFTPDEWVTVPTSKIPGTGVFKYGALAGMVVPGPVWNDIRQISAGNGGPFVETWKTILRAWKLSKTALTPTTHVNNIMGNFVMADMHDVGARDAIAAVRLMVAAANGDKDAKAMLDRFEDSGATQGMFTTHELKKEVLEPLLQQLREEVGMADDEAAILKVSAIMSLALHGQFGEAWAGAKAAAKQSTAGRVTGAVVTKAQDYYQAEDSVFRLAAFLKSIDEGKTDLEAGKLARKAFLDYHINAPWINAMRGTAMPFIAFAYRAIPMLVETAARKPWKIAKYMLVAGGLNALAYAMLGADADEDKERAYLPDEKAGRLWGIVPKLIRMPWNRESKLRDGRTTSDPVFLDVRRWIPVGDVVDYGQDKTALPMIPQPLIPGGPIIMVAEFLVNKSAFTGKELTKETDTWVEKAAKVGGHFYKGFAPNVPIPYSGTWAGTKIDNAVKGKEDPLGRAYPVPEAIASGFGLKFERYPVDTLQRNTVLDMKGKLRELSDAQRQAARDYGRQGMTKRELDEKVGEIVGKKNAAVEEYKAKERKAMGR